MPQKMLHKQKDAFYILVKCCQYVQRAQIGLFFFIRNKSYTKCNCLVFCHLTVWYMYVWYMYGMV